MSIRKQFYLDPELQFPLIAALILLVTLESLLVGWGFYQMIAIAKDWQRMQQAMDFFKVLLLTIFPIVLVNFAFGTYLSHKIAGPLVKVRRAMGEIARGNLEMELILRKNDLLQAYVTDFNQMRQTLRRLIYRDHQYALEVNDLLTECQNWLAQRQDLEPVERQELQKLLKEAKNRLSVINTHFIKGQWERV